MIRVIESVKVCAYVVNQRNTENTKRTFPVNYWLLLYVCEDIYSMAGPCLRTALGRSRVPSEESPDTPNSSTWILVASVAADACVLFYFILLFMSIVFLIVDFICRVAMETLY